MYDANTVRRKFLDYFVERGHSEVPSAPIVPVGDPSLLFTNAGMNQFKDVFLGIEKRSYARATSCQKCLRVSGKHNDLETVGTTERHHTFFEMLGNFSFGDYFKREAIKFAWELMRKVYKIPAERLYATVYENDHEAYNIWKNEIELDESHIWRGGEEDNYWAMGDTGPCGPCSEIHYDKGEEKGAGCRYGEDNSSSQEEVKKRGSVARWVKKRCKGVECKKFGSSECPRFFELWNLVFMEFERCEDGTQRRLPKPSVDTGAGLERICAVLQGVDDNFKTDLFSPIIEHLERISGIKYSAEDKTRSLDYVAFRAIADHIRALVVCIADGIVPSNEGRGYVLRRILRRAFRQGRQLGIHEPFLFRLVDDVVGILGSVYPEIRDSAPFAKEMIKTEEENFNRTLDTGLLLLRSAMEEAKQKRQERGRLIISGEVAFRLFDTYGFPLDLTVKEAGVWGMEVDVDGFNRRLQRQRMQSRRTSRFAQQQRIPLPEKLPFTEFVGYQQTRVEAKVLYATPDLILLDRTPFYAEAGGQVSDEGEIGGEGFRFKVDGVRRYGGLFLHNGKFEEGDAGVAQDSYCVAEIDGERRRAVARAHTATHLLHWALRRVLGRYVRQSGSLVKPDELRFDFTHFRRTFDEQLEEVERLVNEKVVEDQEVTIREMPLRKALDEGVTAIFEEKYGDTVRVVSIGGFSKELCGGTHINHTSQICFFRIVGERGVQSGVRRIEALTGERAIEYVRRRLVELENAHRLLGGARSEPVTSKIKKLQMKMEEMKLWEKTRRRIVTYAADEYQEIKEQRREREKKIKTLIKRSKEVKGLFIVAEKIELFEEDDVGYLRDVVDELKSKSYNMVACLLGVKDGKVLAVIGGKGQVLDVGFDASEAARIVGKVLGGSGGGRKDFAQAGGPNADKIDKALKAFEEYVRRL